MSAPDAPKQGEAIKDLKNSFRTALKNAKIESFRFDDLRDCCASWLMMNGADLNDVRQILGHKSIAMTLRYAHLSPRYLAGKVKLLEKPTLPNSCQMQDATQSKSGQIETRAKSVHFQGDSTRKQLEAKSGKLRQ